MKTSSSNCLGINGGKVFAICFFHLLINRIGGGGCQQESIKSIKCLEIQKIRLKEQGQVEEKKQILKTEIHQHD